MIATQLDLWSLPPAPPPPLPPAPDGWLIWYDDTAVALKHQASGYRLRGDDAAALCAEARGLAPLFAALAGWRVFYDPMAEGRADLHSYTATHEQYAAISAPNLARLALAAHHAGMSEWDYPDVAPDLYDALWLAGWRWDGAQFARGYERIGAEAPVGELWSAT